MTIKELPVKWMRLDRRVETMTIRLSEHTHDTLERISEKYNVSKSAVAADLLVVALDAYETELNNNRRVCP